MTDHFNHPTGLTGSVFRSLRLACMVRLLPILLLFVALPGTVQAQIPPGTWTAAETNKFQLRMTVDTQGQVTGAYLKVYFNDGWMGSQGYSFSANDITLSGSSVLAEKSMGLFNSAGDSLNFYQIAGTFQPNGTLKGTWKSSYYHHPRGMSSRTNSKQGGFTATNPAIKPPIALVPRIAVQQPAGTVLKSGRARSFGTVALRSTVTKTFTIRNTGTANLTNLSVSRSGDNAKDFIVKAPLKTTLAPGAKTTFKVTFKPTAKGVRKTLLRIRSNDKKNDSFRIVLRGKGRS